MNAPAPGARIYTALFPFCGIGAGALGFLRAHVKLFGAEARFRCLGGIDFDALACKGFTYLTGAPALHADIAKLAPWDLLSFFGDDVPDVVFLSPPCKSFSALTSKRARRLRKYRLMNLLALQWIKLMLATWVTKRPRLVLLENVPGIAKLGSALLRKIRSLLRAAGYIVSPGETHDCGEIGALAQHRKRYLLVARHASSVPVLLYQPVRRKVRACGEVLSQLPLPGDPSAGPLHQLPKISLMNWWRLSLIPAGGDWQDLPGMRRGTARAGRKGRAEPVRCEGRRFNNVFCVGSWNAAVGAVTAGAGPSSGGFSVADPRVGTERFGMNQRVAAWDRPAWCVTGATDIQAGAPSVADPRPREKLFRGSYGVLGWGDPSDTVKGQAWVTTGRFTVADPRLNMHPDAHHNLWRVCDWGEPIVTITSATRPGGGAPSIADPRIHTHNPNRHAAKFSVGAWNDPFRTVTGTDTRVGSGAACVADPRIGAPANPHTYGVLRWQDAAHTVTGMSGSPGNGPFSVADPRVHCRARNGFYGVTAWTSPAATVTGSLQVDNGPAAVADPRPGALGLPVTWFARSLTDRPGFPLFLATEDGTWHRPLTTLELAALQGLPTVVDGKPLMLAGSSAKVREHIGNAVPVGAAEAIAGQMLRTLVGADLEVFALSSGGAVWVEPERAALEGSLQ